MTDRQKILIRYRDALKRNRTSYEIGTDGWRRDIPRQSGVYVIWRGDDPVYVGETANLYERFGELERTWHHTIRRKLLKNDKRLKESRLTSYISKNFKISHRAIGIGRKELEEYLICYWETREFNKWPARYVRSEDYKDDDY